MPAIAGVGIIFAKGKGERAGRFDDKKWTTPGEREELYRRVFNLSQTSTSSSPQGTLTSISAFCSRCGFASLAGDNYCARCGQPLAPTGQMQAVSGGQVAPPRSLYETAQAGYVTRQGISRTETGLLLLIIGILLGPIPYANYVGLILAIVGAIMVILGRQVFGERHSRFVIASLIIYLAGIAAMVVNTVGFVFSLLSADIVGNPTLAGQAFTDAFTWFLVGTVIASAITGIAILLFTYALQDSSGKMLLWTGFATILALGIGISYIVGGEVTSAVQQGISSFPPNFSALVALQGRIQFLELLGLIPAFINATAYYLVWSKITRGELPA